MALLSIPMVVALHLYRRKPIVRIVSSLMLWEQKGQLYSAGRKRMPLHRSLSFWLEILCALALSIAIAEPVGCTSTSSQHLVYVIDASASMNANQYWDTLETDIIDDISSSPQGSIFTLIRAGQTPLIIAGPKVPLSEALHAFEQFHPYDSFADLEGSIELASTLTSGAISVYTDQATEEPHPQVDWYSSAQALPNIGIIKAKWQREQVDISILNATESANTGKLILEFNNEEQEVKELQFKAEETIHLHLTVPKSLPALNIRFIPTGPDGLSLDNTVMLLPPENRSLKVAVSMQENTAVSLGLLSTEAKQPPLFRIAEALIPSSPMAADILFTDRNIGGGPETWRLSLHTSDEQVQVAQRSLFINNRHPLLQDISLTNVIWNYSAAKQLRGTPLIQSNQTPLLTEEILNKGQRKVYHINITPSRSTLHQHQAWPIFLAGLLEERRSLLPGLVQSNLRSNQQIQIMKATAGDWTITTPSQTIEKQHNGGLLQIATPELGLYELRKDEQLYQASIALLSRKESDLRQRQSSTQKAVETEDKTTSANSVFLSLFLLLALLAMAWDWKATEVRQ